MRWPSFSTTPVSTVRSGSRSRCFCCSSAAPARPGAPWPRRWYCIWWPGDCILKPLFARPRPCDVNTAITILVKRPHGHSFPSGHTASAFAAAFALWLQNRKLGVPALVLAAFIAFTRLYLYVHFPTDVLGGLVLGLALGALASWLVDSLANKSKKNKAYNAKHPLFPHSENKGCFFVCFCTFCIGLVFRVTPQRIPWRCRRCAWRPWRTSLRRSFRRIPG